ncbi:MAG: sugar phosphate isomerase/epimerase, partial [Planctomycetaceae bacterium]|nr:sugar phosphate isomerase/epimerase [Planctomycetaceae bacterium]
PPYLAALRELDIQGTVSIELEYSPEPDQIVQWVTEAYQATAQLMADAGLRTAHT